MVKNIFNTKKYCLIIVLIFFIVPINLFSQSKTEKIDAIMKAYHAYNMFDGSVLVAEQGKIIYKKAFGQANREWNISNTTDTKFMIGSISKSLTSILTLIEVQKGRINLDKTISDYLPEFSPKNGKRITIRQLLNHTSGMPNYEIVDDFFPRISRKYFTRDEYIKLFMDSALVFSPSTSFSYSSWGYYTMGYILEKVTGRTYSQLMKEEIFDKLNMSGSGSYFHTQIISKRAIGYDYSLDSYKTGDFRDQSNAMGTGDIYSTVEDLFKLHLALSSNKLLNAELTNEMFKPGTFPGNYGLGWFNNFWKYTPTDSVFTNYHLGMTEGFISFLVRIPATNSMVVILCNSSPTEYNGICNNLIKILFNKPASVKEPLHKKMATIISSAGIDSAILFYDKYKNDTAHYDIAWWGIDQLGHQLYELKRYSEALRIFQKNEMTNPKRIIVLISLAKGYEATGNKKEAISVYQRILTINPNNQEAKSRIQVLH
jgi:CubicO group peptidase (beta-lactamase class C family)